MSEVTERELHTPVSRAAALERALAVRRARRELSGQTGRTATVAPDRGARILRRAIELMRASVESSTHATDD